MVIYCFACPSCGTKLEVGRAAGDTRCPSCSACGCPTSRDYNTEFKSQVIAVPVHMQSKIDVRRDDFLPTAKDFEKPGDTDGSKGMKTWKDEHKLKGSRWV